MYEGAEMGMCAKEEHVKGNYLVVYFMLNDL